MTVRNLLVEIKKAGEYKYTTYSELKGNTVEESLHLASIFCRTHTQASISLKVTARLNVKVDTMERIGIPS